MQNLKINIIWLQDANLATQLEVMSTVEAGGALHARLHQCMVENLSRRKKKSSYTLLNSCSCQCLRQTLIMKRIISTSLDITKCYDYKICLYINVMWELMGIFVRLSYETTFFLKIASGRTVTLDNCWVCY